ncbi:PRC-barrel domain containing protein [Streptomyces sp. NPDC048603]|uniref:PRC-barrel domain containing protein n=1 Tax=Streptomyces sp. NPDC048603 TaxID=3365577 RepID=UPI003716A30B
MGKEMWAYADSGGSGSGHVAGADLAGFRVDAEDGHIGHIDKHSLGAARAYIVVDTGPWILGRRKLIPAGLVKDVDLVNETVHVAATKERIKASPDFESGQYEDEDLASIRITEQHHAYWHS